MQPARLMKVMASKAKIRIDSAGQFSATAIGIIVVTGLHRARTVSQLANRADMILRIVIVRAANLFPLSKKSPRDAVARIAFLAWLGITWTPNKILRTCYRTVVLLHN